MPTFIHRNRLALAIAAFVLLDLGTLAFSYSISSVVEKDAVAINLAGRQRMLSQRITKAALLATSQSRSAAQRAASVAELSQSYQVFRLTLSAFANGGETKGGDNRLVRLDPVKGTAALLVGEVQGMLDAWPNAPTEEADVERFSAFMDARNADILDSMNRLTTELEQQSIAAVSRLRVAQTLAFLLSLANFVIILRTMQRARQRAEAESLTDALTGLRNRAGLYRELDAALQHCAASGTPLGVMLLDLDDFKAVNDTYGHAAGDATLREAARRLQDWSAPDWTCCRLGGDEFAVICPGIEPIALAAAGRDLNQVLSGIPGGGLIVSASVGWASAQPKQSADAIVAIADSMMYAAKSQHQLTRNFRETER